MIKAALLQDHYIDCNIMVSNPVSATSLTPFGCNLQLDELQIKEPKNVY